MAANPIPIAEDEQARFLVAFANDAATLAGLASLLPLAQAPERLVVGQPGRPITTRNWRTTCKLLALCSVDTA